MNLPYNTYIIIILPIFLSLPAFVYNDPFCSAPYECLSLRQCVKKLSGSVPEEIIFRCEDTGKICCPTGRDSTTPASQTDFHTGYEAESNNRTRYGSGIKPCSSSSLNTTSPNTRKDVPAFPTHSSFESHKNFRLLPSKCGIIDLTDKIIEGEEANLGEYPWMTLVGFQDKFGKLKWICGGTLINSRYVLTAAHCVYRDYGSLPVVRLGEHNLDNATDCDMLNSLCLEPPQDFYPEQIIVHDEWNKTAIKNDIALFRLPREIPESFSISPICLPIGLKKNNSSEDEKFVVAGWGKTEWNSELGSNVLRKATLSGVINDNCGLCKGKKKERYCPITDKQICAQGWKSVDVCKGDSGGPLMTVQNKIYQVGITSFKTSEYCGADNIPSVFTRVESYLDWILDNIKE